MDNQFSLFQFNNDPRIVYLKAQVVSLQKSIDYQHSLKSFDSDVMAQNFVRTMELKKEQYLQEIKELGIFENMDKTCQEN